MEKFKCMLCASNLEFNDVTNLLNHLIDLHYDDETIPICCGYEDCGLNSEITLRSYKRHLQRAHSSENFVPLEVYTHFSKESFFMGFLQTKGFDSVEISLSGMDIEDPVIPIPSPEMYIHDSVHSMRPSFIDQLGKIAFRHIYSSWPSKSSTIKLLSEITTLYASVSPLGEEMQYASHVFANEYRIKKFFSQQYNILKV